MDAKRSTMITCASSGWLSEELYWQQFVQSRPEFEATVLKAQIEWLGAFMESGIRADGSSRI